MNGIDERFAEYARADKDADRLRAKGRDLLLRLAAFPRWLRPLPRLVGRIALRLGDTIKRMTTELRDNE